MKPGQMAVASLGIGAGVTLLTTPLAIRAARRWDFLDHPGGHKRHAAPTPYLGGTAVLAGVAVAVGASAGPRYLARADAPMAVTCLGTAAMWTLGTRDDRRPVAWQLRLGTAAISGLALSCTGGGFRVCRVGPLDAALTGIWIAGLTVAYNLMDNLDGACASVAGTSALGVTVIGLMNGEAGAATTAAALAGACLTFLRANLALPRARIYLGDGGSMPIGLLLGALAIRATSAPDGGAGPLLSAALLCGLPILDTTLVTVGRPRRGISILQGGQDHLSHHVLRLRGTPRRTARVLAGAQALSAGCAVAGRLGGERTLTRLATAAVSIGAVVIAAVEVFPPPTSQP